MKVVHFKSFKKWKNNGGEFSIVNKIHDLQIQKRVSSNCQKKEKFMKDYRESGFISKEQKYIFLKRDIKMKKKRRQ